MSEKEKDVLIFEEYREIEKNKLKFGLECTLKMLL
jgi:hypothetical protein